jgi:hypothetical protein
VLLALHVRDEGADGAERGDSHGKGRGRREALLEHREHRLEGRDGEGLADLLAERAEEFQPGLLAPGILGDAEVEDEREELVPRSAGADDGRELRRRVRERAAHERDGLVREALEEPGLDRRLRFRRGLRPRVRVDVATQENRRHLAELLLVVRARDLKKPRQEGRWHGTQLLQMRLGVLHRTGRFW